MRRDRTSSLLFLAFIMLACAGSSGCRKGPVLVKVKGAVSIGGQPVQMPKVKKVDLPSMMVNGQLVEVKASSMEGASLVVVFHPLNDKRPLGENGPIGPPAIYSALVDPDGSFTVPGDQGKGISPGKYRVVVQLLAMFSNEDQFKDAFGPNRSKITVTIPGDVKEHDVEIDLADPAYREAPAKPGQAPRR